MQRDLPPVSAAKDIVLFAVGSRGDVQPSCVLAAALRARGHTVHMATQERLRPLVEEFGLAWRKLEGDHAGVLHEPAAQAALRDGSFFRLMRLTKEWEARFDKKAYLASFLAASAGADIIVASALTITETLCVAQARGAALVALLPGPTWPTSEYPLWALPVPCSCLYRWSYTAAFSSLWAQERGVIEPWRRELGLQPLPHGVIAEYERAAFPVLIAASELLCGPTGKAPADYPPHVIVGGFLIATEAADARAAAAGAGAGAEADGRARAGGCLSAKPLHGPPAHASDPELLAFAAGRAGAGAGAAPLPLVYFGFGSMPAPDPLELLRLVVETCAAARCRGVLVAGWTALSADPQCARLAAEATASGSLLVRQAVSHSFLFPRCAAVIHHCGVGTFAAALHAGVPQLPCPFMLDQPHNARLALRLGVAPTIVPFDKQITSAKLARALRVILDEEGDGPLCASAQRVGERVRAESSGTVARFVAAVETAERPARHVTLAD